jgi:predicted ATPase/class 3 adenylate cyclase
LFTDIEGSTRLWEDEPEAMRQALARHDEVLRTAIDAHGGTVFSTAGDSFAASFPDAGAGLRAAIDAQLGLSAESWPLRRPLRARMGLHTDALPGGDGSFFGAPLNRCARLMGAAHGSQVLCTEATAVLARDGLRDICELVDLGEHRLRDLARPLRVFQLVHPSLPRDFPPLRSLDAYPTNLPAQLSAFIGRDDELRTIAKALAESRAVTLTGVGGVGKTRLAVQVAADVLPAYADGAWLVELGGVADADAVEEAVAATLTVQQQPGQTLRDSLLSFLRMKQLLVLLDNCEHLLEPVADFVERALRAAPRLTVLATSREALGVAGERVLGVRSLALPAANDDAAAVAAADAVRLFVERAQSARAGFTLTGDNNAAVAQLCRRLDGIPLAIELAAARVRSMAPAEISGRLDQRFRLLTGGTRRTANRHQTLRRAIDWSWELMADDERALLRRLAVCVGGFDLAAAEAIGSGGAIDAFDVDDLLGRLVDKSLVVVEDLGEATRYRLLETIREYALERLEDADEVDEARSRHACHYAAFAEEVGAGLKGVDERAWLERAERELDNLRLAVTWSADSGQVELALRIVNALALNGLRIQTSVGAWAETATAAAGARRDRRFPGALGAMAWATLRKGGNEQAMALGREALALSTADTLEGAAQRARILSTTAGIQGSLGMLPDRAAVAEWVELAERVADPYEEANALTMLSVSLLFSGEDGAVEAGERALDRARRSGSPTALTYAGFCLARAIGSSDPERALRLFAESIASAEAAGNEFGAWVASQSRGQLLSAMGNHVDAMRSFLEGAVRSGRAGDRSQQANCVWSIGAELAIAGSLDAAATIAGWARSVLGTDFRASGPGQHLNAGLDALPGLLGEQLYTELTTRGAAMDHDEALRFARANIESLLATEQ